MKSLQIITPRAIFITLALAGLVTFYAAPAKAESTQTTTSASQIFSASNQSSFQDAGFQQSGSSAATTAGGSASALHQVATGPITVSGAPATQTATTKNNSSVKLWLGIICLASAIGLLALYIYGKRTTSKQSIQEAVFAEEVIQETKAKKASKKTEEKAEASDAPVKSAKPKKTAKKKKNKKHHR